MFEVFYRKYKDTMCKESLKESIKEIDSFILVALILMFVGGLVMVISTLIGSDSIIPVGSFLVFFLSFVIALIRYKYLLSDPVFQSKVESRKRDRFKKFVWFLNDSQIELDDTQIDTLIKIAQAKQDISDDSKSLINGVTGVFKYVFIPIITLLIKDYLDEAEIETIIIRIFTIVVISLVLTVSITMVYVTLKSFFNGEREKLRELIADLTEVKSFKSQAKEIYESKEKLKGIV